MTAFRSTLLLALAVGQAAAFVASDKPVKALGPLQSVYNRNYDSVGYDGGMRRYNDYGRNDNRQMDYNRGYGGGYGGGYGYGAGYGGGYGYDSGFGGNDRGYGYGGYGSSRSKFGDWLQGSSNFIPTSTDRSYVMDRGYENGNRYGSSMYYNSDRYSNNRYGGGYGGGGYGGNSMGMGYNSNYSNRDYSDRYSTRGYGYGPRDYSGGRNSYDRYSPVSYNRGGGYDRDYNRGVNGGYNRNYRDGRSLNSEYSRTYRSANDSHRQDYPNYGMGGMEDQFGYKKWWDSN
eukprot:scaffold1823_cov108-Cylindrotheca_fusiformis.AAC.10